MSTIYLVSCVASKSTSPAAAKDLYQSDWFIKARRFVEYKDSNWYILSAEHGLLVPDRIIAPYEKTLKTMPIAQRRQWADRVMRDLTPLLAAGDRVVILAGAAYRDLLSPAINALGAVVEVPMERLRIGEQLRWLGRQVEGK